MNSWTWERISNDAEYMRAREKSERYFCNPHTSGTRKRRPIFRYGQVGEDSFNSCSFHLAGSRFRSRSRVCNVFRIPRKVVPPSPKKRARTIVTKPESFADRSRVNCSLPTVFPPFILPRPQSLSFFFLAALC